MPTYAALLEALAEAKKGRENLAGELRVVRTERDLLKEQLNEFKRQLFAAKSEAGATHQKDMFFNEAPLICGDETEIQVLKEAGRTAQAKSYMWAQMTNRSGPDGTGPPIRLFAHSPSRSTEAAERLYVGVRDGTVLMTDGYEVYNKIAKAHKLVHLGCWAHCRRYFHDAMQALPKNSRRPEQLASRSNSGSTPTAWRCWWE